MSVTTLWDNCQYAKCFGNWMLSDSECLRCTLSDMCEKRTKMKVSETKEESEEISSEIKEQPEISPLDYLIQSLSGKFDHETEEKDKAVIHKFRQDGKIVFAIIVGAYGKLKIMSILKNQQKIFGSLQSIEEVESILSEML